MLHKVMQVLSGIAAAVLITGAYMSTPVHASGTNQVAVMSLGTDAVSNTIRSENIVGAIAFVLMAIGGALLMRGDVGGGLFGFFMILIGVGVLMNGREVVEGIGFTAASL